MEKSKSTINGVTLLNSVCLFKTMQFAASTSRGIKIVHCIWKHSVVDRKSRNRSRIAEWDVNMSPKQLLYSSSLAVKPKKASGGFPKMTCFLKYFEKIKKICFDNWIQNRILYVKDLFDDTGEMGM